jgi:hypothetical protein
MVDETNPMEDKLAYYFAVLGNEEMIGDKEVWLMLLGKSWMPIAHWVLGFGVGLLLFWLTSTTLLKFSCFQNKIGVFSIRGFSLLVALLCSVVVHIAEDYIFDIF